MSAADAARCRAAIESLARLDGFRVARLELVPLPSEEKSKEGAHGGPGTVLVQTPAEFAAGRGGRWRIER